MLNISELTKLYGKTKAVDHVNFVVPSGKVGILLGPNGAGKSTIIKCIAGLLRYQGEINICNYPSRSMEAKKVFGYVPELPALYEALTIREHIEFVLRAYGVEKSENEINALLDRFDLLDKKEKLGNELSKGMMQKVSICCAFIIQPKVILLDEPMVGLDPKAIKELKQYVLELKEQGVTILISTHMLEMVKDLWDIMFIMNKGTILASYKKEDVADQDIEDLFFGITDGEKQ